MSGSSPLPWRIPLAGGLEKMRRMSRRLATPRMASQAAGVVRVAPAEDLADLVEQHWIVAWDYRGRPPVRQEVLPDPSINLAVEPAGRLLYGVGSGHVVRTLEGKGLVVGTKFRPGGFSGFLPGPVSALTGRILTLGEAFGAAGARLDAALVAAADVDAIIAEVSAFLRTHRPAPDRQRALVMEIVQAMRTASPNSVTSLAAGCGVTPRTLQRMFAQHVGATPKQVLQRFRRQQAADQIREEKPTSLARLAVDLGYFDQSHLARDFRAALGRSPSAVAASG